MANLYLNLDSTGTNLNASSSLNITALNINGVSPSQDQFLTTNTLSTLQWIPKPISVNKTLIQYTVSNHDYNQFPVGGTSLFDLPIYNGLVSELTFSSGNAWTVNPGFNGIYQIQYYPVCNASVSSVEFTLGINTVSKATTIIDGTGTTGSLFWIGNLNLGDTIVIFNNRVGLSAISKNNLTGVPSIASPIIITKLT